MRGRSPIFTPLNLAICGAERHDFPSEIMDFAEDFVDHLHRAVGIFNHHLGHRLDVGVEITDANGESLSHLPIDQFQSPAVAPRRTALMTFSVLPCKFT